MNHRNRNDVISIAFLLKFQRNSQTTAGNSLRPINPINYHCVFNSHNISDFFSKQKSMSWKEIFPFLISFQPNYNFVESISRTRISSNHSKKSSKKPKKTDRKTEIKLIKLF